MLVKQPHKSSFRESLKALEADIQHANSLAAAIPKDYGGEYVQMRLSYSTFAPFVLFLIEWMDYSCTDSLPTSLGLLHILVYKVYVDGMPTLSSKERKASLREFYGLLYSLTSFSSIFNFLYLFFKLMFGFIEMSVAAVIYPSLRQLEGEFVVLEENNVRNCFSEVSSRNIVEDWRKLSDKDLERDNECGICMENCTKMVLPNCGHSLCSSCFHDWNMRSQSCPFCRGGLKRVSSKDLWVLISSSDVIDRVAIAKENLRCFYLYMENLPLITPETHLYVHDYMI